MTDPAAEEIDDHDFDPEAPQEGGGNYKYLEVAGDYLLVLSDWKGRGKSRNGKPYIEFWVAVIGGDHDGESFAEKIYLSKAALSRLKSLTLAMGLTSADKFSLKSDESVKRALLFRPFKCSVKIDEGNSKKWAKLGRFLDMTADEGKIGDSWRADKLAEYEVDGKDPYASKDKADDFRDDDGGFTGGGDPGGDPAAGMDDAPFPDDIPF